MSELKSRPPVKPKLQDMDAFILGADAKAKESETAISEAAEPANVNKGKTLPRKKKVYPWEEPGIRDDVIKVYNLRLPEAYLLKLKYISENTPDSMQKFCLQVMQNAIDKKIKELIP